MAEYDPWIEFEDVDRSPQMHRESEIRSIIPVDEREITTISGMSLRGYPAGFIIICSGRYSARVTVAEGRRLMALLRHRGEAAGVTEERPAVPQEGESSG